MNLTFKPTRAVVCIQLLNKSLHFRGKILKNEACHSFAACVVIWRPTSSFFDQVLFLKRMVDIFVIVSRVSFPYQLDYLPRKQNKEQIKSSLNPSYI